MQNFIFILNKCVKKIIKFVLVTTKKTSSHVQVNLKYSIEFNQTSTIKCSNQNYVLKSIEFWY